MSTIKRKACIVIELPKVAYTLSQNSEKSVNTVDLRINAQSVFNFFFTEVWLSMTRISLRSILRNSNPDFFDRIGDFCLVCKAT